MAIVKWRKQAWQLFNRYVENARVEYGEKPRESGRLKLPLYMTDCRNTFNRTRQKAFCLTKDTNIAVAT